MGKSKQRRGKTSATHMTQIGTVTGQVHTGSGNIIVKGFGHGGTIASKEEFLAALREFRAEVEAARQQGLPEETSRKAIGEVEAAEQEVKKNDPKTSDVIKRLEKAKAVLVAGTGVASATATAAEAAGKLVPMIENAIQIVRGIFGA